MKLIGNKDTPATLPYARAEGSNPFLTTSGAIGMATVTNFTVKEETNMLTILATMALAHYTIRVFVHNEVECLP